MAEEKLSLSSVLVKEERDYVIARDGKQVTFNELKGRTVGIYFSAHWCGPCKAFTPTLVSAYNEIKEQGKAFEIIFVSSDREEEKFESYYGEMPWLALPFSDKERKKNLLKGLEINGIPCLVIFDADGNLVSKEGRKLIEELGAKAFPFTAATQE